MHVQWYGQSSFRVRDDAHTIIIDPIGDLGAVAARGLQMDYPPLSGEPADLLLVTHEHADHTGVEQVGGDPMALRSTPGSHESPVGEVLGVASEHDPVAGTARGANTIFVFELDGQRIAHLGDFGQHELRPEQLAAMGRIDLAFVPVGGHATIDGPRAAAVAGQIGARWIVPMHYRTRRTNFLETADAFLEAMPYVWRGSGPGFDTTELPGDSPLAVVPAAP
jgi:L-ascorbate metabolism protein UlaG (beta-lactamase superfamily)